jgi:high-affinity nickel-transport protein
MLDPQPRPALTPLEPAMPSWRLGRAQGAVFMVLFGLAFLNLRAVLLTDPLAVVAPIGIKSRLLGRFVTVKKPWAVAAVGMLFAFSFDTISQATLFALAAGRFGGVAEALLVAGLFVLGMLVVDGINGVWISRLIRRAHSGHRLARNGATVAGISLAVGCFTVAKLFLPAVDVGRGREVLVGGAVVLGVLTAFTIGMVAARSVPVATGG